MQPASSQVWLDYAKLEEEVGDLLSAKVCFEVQVLLYKRFRLCFMKDLQIVSLMKIL